MNNTESTAEPTSRNEDQTLKAEPHPTNAQPGPLGLLGLAVWLGLLSGFLELVLFVVLRDPTGNLYYVFGKSRHYPWMIPVTNALLFVAFTLPVATLSWRWRRFGAWLGLILLGTLTLLPPLLVVLHQLWAIALVVLSMGVASRLVPWLRRRGRFIRWSARLSMPVMMIGVVLLAGWTFSRNLHWGEPSGVKTAEVAERPNVLLLVLDTVRADAMSLYGYERPTTPRLSEYAERGVVFTQARAPAPWTLTSHASFFTGRWPHELSARHYTPLDDQYPTLAELLSAEGFETAGFVANSFYCSYYTGLDRGFNHYEDIPTTPFRALVTTELGTHLLDFFDEVFKRIDPDHPRSPLRSLNLSAEHTNRQFLNWLDDRSASDPPFFAFLNYFDAHDPYIVPEGAKHRFGRRPETPEEQRLLINWWFQSNKHELPPEQLALAKDGYDSCLAYLDEQIGQLLDTLEQRGVLNETIVIIASDHGESFGEHDLFGHGGTLYEPELHVPLLVFGPTINSPGSTVEQPVSLRDLPATITDLLAIDDHPLPGTSLAVHWTEEENSQTSPSLSEVFGPSAFPPNHGRSPVVGGPMTALVDNRLFKYIYQQSRTGRGGSEQLYQLKTNPDESFNLAGPQFTELLGKFRSLLTDLLSGNHATSP